MKYKILVIICLISFLNGFSQDFKRFKHFTIGYDSIGTKWCSYFVTDSMALSEVKTKRRGFRKFNNIKDSDYRNTGYDRGHLMPANFLKFDSIGYYESFSLANVVPMAPKFNRGLWKFLEEQEKRFAVQYKCIRTDISIYYGSKKIGNLHIPEHFKKSIYTCTGILIEDIQVINF